MDTAFINRLRQTMLLKGIRQSELVEKTGIDKGSMSSYVNGRYMPNAENTAKIAKALGVSVDFLLGKEDIPKMSMLSVKKVPIFREVAAGVPIEANEDVIGSLYSSKMGDLFALKVKGDSMSPRITDGDIVLVRKQSYAEDGDVVIALIDNEATCKVFKRSGDTIMLVPFNATFTPLVFTGEDIRILGKVIESRHEW